MFKLIYNRPTTLLLEKCAMYVYILDRTEADNIETRSWEM